MRRRSDSPAHAYSLLCITLLFSFVAPAFAASVKCSAPRILTFQVEKETRRDNSGFTEGLEVHDGALFESTGDFFGDTRINRIEPNGHVVTVMDAGKGYFGEGLTFFGGKLYQMTYREHRVFVFDQGDMRPLPELANPREGWGLTHDATQLIASDGTSHLYLPARRTTSTPSGELLVVEDGITISKTSTSWNMSMARCGPMSSSPGRHGEDLARDRLRPGRRWT